MGLIESLYKKINSGRSGDNIGIPTGMPDLDKYTYGIQRGFMTTIAGDSGAGKTTYTLFTHVYKPIQYAIEHPETPVNILYFSLEMSGEVLLAKLLSLHILDQYKKIISYKEILSLGEVLNEEKYELILKAKTWLEKAINHLIVYDKFVDAAGVYTIVRNWVSNFGHFEEDEYAEKYISKIDSQYKIVVIDHVRLLSGSDKRVEINKCTDYLIRLRDMCSLTIALVQQLNRQFKSMERRTSNYQMIQLDDLADSSGSAQGSEIVIGLYYPYREKRTTCEGYDIKKLRDQIRIVQILKHRYGISDVMKGVFFKGEVGYYKELPNPNNTTLNYDEILSDDYIFTESHPIDNIEQIDNVNNTTSTEDLLNRSGNNGNINFNFTFD